METLYNPDPNASKKELFDQYKQLWDAYQQKERKLKDTERQLDEARKHQKNQSDISQSDAMQSVMKTLGQMRGLI